MERNDIDTFEKLKAQLDSLHHELSTLARKSPNDLVNKFKLKFVNDTLERCNKFLGKKYTPFLDFKKFSEDELPSNSDVTFMLSQYIECAEKFRADNVERIGGEWRWRVDDAGEPVRTARPKKLEN